MLKICPYHHGTHILVSMAPSVCVQEVFSPSHEWIVAGPVRNVITPLDNTKNGKGCLAFLSGLPRSHEDWVEATD